MESINDGLTEKKLIKEFIKLYEKQEMLTKLTSQELSNEYGYSEIHCINYIGLIDKPNVTKIANKLDMTRGAVSKILNRLNSKGAVYKYQSIDNRKEVYFGLTKKGESIFEEHKIKHELCEKREELFFQQLSKKEIFVVNDVITKFNKYLDKCIVDLLKC